MPSLSTNQRKVYTVRWSSLKPTAAPSCFFLYYFRYTSRPYDEQEPLLKDLNQCVEYRKTIDFFIKTKGLHGYFERNGGYLEKAVSNANRSMDEKLQSGRNYTYSGLGKLIRILKNL